MHELVSNGIAVYGITVSLRKIKFTIAYREHKRRKLNFRLEK